MLYLRVDLIPKPALSYVRINGREIAEGEDIQAYGTLSVGYGDFKPSEVRVYNNGILWTPVSHDSGHAEYSVMSGGRFEIKVPYNDIWYTLMYFSNSMAQDFTIDKVLFWQDNRLETYSTSVGKYYQGRGGTSQIWYMQIKVYAIGPNLDSLQPSIVGGIFTSQKYADGVFTIEFGRNTGTDPVEIHIGNVLVCYIVRT